MEYKIVPRKMTKEINDRITHLKRKKIPPQGRIGMFEKQPNAITKIEKNLKR